MLKAYIKITHKNITIVIIDDIHTTIQDTNNTNSETETGRNNNFEKILDITISIMEKKWSHFWYEPVYISEIPLSVPPSQH